MCKAILSVLALGVISVILSSCGSTDSASTTTGATDISSMPDASGPVVDGSSVMKSFARPAASLQLATTGKLARTFSGLTWGSDKSGPFCQAGSMAKDQLSNAMQSDKIKCYIGNGERHGIFPVSYDGANHYIQFTNAEEGAPKIKYNFTKTNGVITSFKMWMCFNTSSQDEYVSAVADTSGGMTFTSVGVHSNEGWSGSNRTTATGTVNSDGNWVGSKNISSQFEGAQSGGSSFSMEQNLEGTFTPDDVTLSGYFTSSFGGNSNSGRMYTIMQLLNADDLMTLAFGGGTTKFSFNWGGTTHTRTKAWDGDSAVNLSDETAGDFYTAVNAATLPTVSSVAISFGSEETWDCTAEAGSSFTSADFSLFEEGAAAAGMAACDARFFNDRTNMQCHEAAF